MLWGLFPLPFWWFCLCVGIKHSCPQKICNSVNDYTFVYTACGHMCWRMLQHFRTVLKFPNGNSKMEFHLLHDGAKAASMILCVYCAAWFWHNQAKRLQKLELFQSTWQIIDTFLPVMKPLAEATETLSKEDYPSAFGIYPLVIELLSHHLVDDASKV